MSRCPQCKSNAISTGRTPGIGMRNACLQCGAMFPVKEEKTKTHEVKKQKDKSGIKQ